MVVDDDPDVLMLMREILARANYQVTTASSGLEALEKLGLQPYNPALELPDLVVLDIMLPKVDGYGVASMLRNNLRTRDIPVVVTTALKDVSRLFSATVKINGLVTKPFDPAQLLNTITESLNNPATYKPNPFLAVT